MTRGSETFETRHRRKDGSIIDVEVAASRLDRPEGPSLVCFLRDITERKHHEQQLRDSQALNRALFEQALISIFIADMSGRFIDVNDTACRTTGFSPAELLEMSVFDLNERGVSHSWKEALLDEWRRWKPGEHYTRESVYTRKDGTRYPVLISTGIIQYGETRAVAAAVMDISEQKAAEAAVQELLAEKGTLFEELQHRIKNNINTMASLLSLQANSVDDPSAIAALQDATSRVNSLGVLYDHLYAVDTANRGSIRTYLEMLIERETELFAMGKGVTTRSELDECLCPARILSTVGLIANELITNVMKHAFHNQPAPMLTLTGVYRDGRYCLTVQDNGPGIPKAPPPRGGSGFGLMVITTLTEQLDGTITFENDHGTRVTLDFPVSGD
jgi:PAS domain S-box-containing protein